MGEVDTVGAPEGTGVEGVNDGDTDMDGAEEMEGTNDEEGTSDGLGV